MTWYKLLILKIMEKMNLFEMQAIAGGISREEYCAELDAIMSDNWGKFTKSEKRAAAKSFAQNC